MLLLVEHRLSHDQKDGNIHRDSNIFTLWTLPGYLVKAATLSTTAPHPHTPQAACFLLQVVDIWSLQKPEWVQGIFLQCRSLLWRNGGARPQKSSKMCRVSLWSKNSFPSPPLSSKFFCRYRLKYYYMSLLSLKNAISSLKGIGSTKGAFHELLSFELFFV